MTDPFVHLPDEILLMIMSKLCNVDVLYSLMDVCERLDRLARDLVHTRSIDLTETTSNDEIRPLSDKMLDRFCENLLPRIHQNIECLTVESSSIHRLFQSLDYPKLSKLVFPELDLESVSKYLNEETSFIRICNEQISHAVVTVVDKVKSASLTLSDVATNLYLPIFNRLKSVTHLEFVIKDSFQYPPLSLEDLPPTACFSSTLVHLSIRLMDFEDCLFLLDGRLNQLHTLNVEIHGISATNDLQNTKCLPNLKCFSLISYKRTYAYDTRILPLLHRMSALEKLTLSLYIAIRTSFIDGFHLNNEIQSRLPYLSTFIFNIHTNDVPFPDEDRRPSSDDIRRTFVEGTSFDCYVDYDCTGAGRCHVYSFPLPLTHFHGITNNFPGGQFISVRTLYVVDTMYPFEHEFFQRINHSFPFVRHIGVFNLREQTRQCADDEQVSSMIEYSHVTELDVEYCRIDYVKQFLIDSRIYLPRLHSLRIQYEHLAIVTENFTNNATRLNCAKVKHLITEATMVYSKDVYSYFPSL